MLPALYTLSSLRFWLARNARAYTSARSIGFCVIWICISSSSSSNTTPEDEEQFPLPLPLFPLTSL